MNTNYKSIILVIGLFLAVSASVSAAPGDLDLIFGSGGIAVTSITNEPYSAAPLSMKVQPDGKIVVGGEIREYDPEGYSTISCFLARFHSTGALDASFGTNGKIVAPFNSGDGNVGREIVLQPDGKIVAVGYGGNSAFAVHRYNANGTLDASFGAGGVVLTPVGTGGFRAAESVAIQADGKIVVVGGGSSSSFIVVRYNPNGSLDTSFGEGGKVFTNFNYSSSAFAVMLQADGKIVAAGYAGIQNPGSYIFGFALARYNTDGSLDSGFGAGGKVTHAVSTNYNFIHDVALQPDGKIVATGSSGPGSAIVRYNANGSIDTSFAQNGIFITEANFYVGNGIAVQSNGKIVAFGDEYSNNRTVIARLNPNGTPDTSFGNNGRVITPIYSYRSFSGGAGGAIQSDGKILALGSTGAPNGGSDIAIVRYLGDFTAARRTPFDFDGDGEADISVFRPSDRVWYLNQSTNGLSATQFGLSTDKITPADYDGDGKTDVAVFRDDVWYLQRSSLGFTAVAFGAATDIPTPADFDADGKAEIAVFRPSNGSWYIYNLATNQATGFAFGQSGDIPVAADYDGDGKSDVAVFRNGTWYLSQSTNGLTTTQFGLNNDIPIPSAFIP